MKAFWNNAFNVVIDFCIRYKRYFAAAGVFAAIMLLLAFGTEGTVSDQNPMAGAYQAFEENQDEEIEELIEAYFANYAAGNVEQLKAIATPISDAEASYIQFYSQYLEKYQNIRVYTKRGIDDKSYLCSVYLEIKFKEIDTPAAGLEFFYLDTNDDGKLYINKVYGSFNQKNGEFDMDADIAALIATFEQQEDVLALQAEVQEKYNQAMLTDEKLNAFINSEEAKAAEEAAAQAAAEEANASMKTVTTKINVRAEASETADSLGQLEAGTQVKCYSDAGGWTKIDYNGTKAYVKSEFLEAAEGTDTTAEEPQSTGGRTILLTNTVNVRAEMSETADKVTVAYPGNNITIYQDYAEGWSKVSYEGKEGYCKTELLK